MSTGEIPAWKQAIIRAREEKAKQAEAAKAGHDEDLSQRFAHLPAWKRDHEIKKAKAAIEKDRLERQRKEEIEKANASRNKHELALRLEQQKEEELALGRQRAQTVNTGESIQERLLRLSTPKAVSEPASPVTARKARRSSSKPVLGFTLVEAVPAERKSSDDQDNVSPRRSASVGSLNNLALLAERERAALEAQQRAEKQRESLQSQEAKRETEQKELVERTAAVQREREAAEREAAIRKQNEEAAAKQRQEEDQAMADAIAEEERAERLAQEERIAKERSEREAERKRMEEETQRAAEERRARQQAAQLAEQKRKEEEQRDAKRLQERAKSRMANPDLVQTHDETSDAPKSGIEAGVYTPEPVPDGETPDQARERKMRDRVNRQKAMVIRRKLQTEKNAKEAAIRESEEERIRAAKEAEAAEKERIRKEKEAARLREIEEDERRQRESLERKKAAWEAQRAERERLEQMTAAQKEEEQAKERARRDAVLNGGPTSTMSWPNGIVSDPSKLKLKRNITWIDEGGEPLTSVAPMTFYDDGEPEDEQTNQIPGGGDDDDDDGLSTPVHNRIKKRAPPSKPSLGSMMVSDAARNVTTTSRDSDARPDESAAKSFTAQDSPSVATMLW